jgi:hypothetical protein
VGGERERELERELVWPGGVRGEPFVMKANCGGGSGMKLRAMRDER